MAIHELDELADRIPMRVLGHDGVAGYAGPSLAGDAEQTAVLVTIVGWRDGKEATFMEWFTVDHYGTDIDRVHMPPGWRAIARQVGLDDELIATEGYLETLARLEFARRGGR
jgi:hypothetical protein